MNRIYKIIWNAHLSCMQMVSELAHCPQNAGSSMVAKSGTWGKWVIFNLALLPISVLAAVNATTLPISGQVTQGSAQIHQQGNVLNIQQQSQYLNTQWQAFNIGQKATVNFKQLNASSVAVNQILDHNPSQIMGRLNANGQVFLINSNGMIFGSGSQVHVGGLVASTLKIEQHDALIQRFKLRGDAASQARIENHGHIIGGSVALLAPNVINTGHITTPNGVTHLVAANQVSLLLQDGSLIQLQVEEGVLQGLVDNQGAIVADNGWVYLTAQGKDALSRAVVNHSGIIEANRSATNAQGEKIVLLGDMQTGVTNVRKRYQNTGATFKDAIC